MGIEFKADAFDYEAEYEKIKKGLADDAVSALITPVDRMDKKADDAGKEMFDFLIKAGSRNGLTK